MPDPNAERERLVAAVEQETDLRQKAADRLRDLRFFAAQIPGAETEYKVLVDCEYRAIQRLAAFDAAHPRTP